MERIAPVDELGVPLPIITELSSIRPENNDHHHWHPGAVYKDGRGSKSGLLALRQSRIQKTLVSDHNAYHAHFYGHEKPRSRLRRLELTVLCASGYIPDKGIMIHDDGGYSIEPISEEQRRHLWASGQIRVSLQDGQVKNFCVHELIRNSVKLEVSERLVDQLMGGRDEERRRKAAAEILRVSARHTLSGLSEGWSTSWYEGKLPVKAECWGGQTISLPNSPASTICNISIPREIQSADSTSKLVGRFKKKMARR